MRRFEIRLEDGNLFFEGVQYPDGDYAGRVHRPGKERRIYVSGHDMSTIAGIFSVITMIDENNA